MTAKEARRLMPVVDTAVLFSEVDDFIKRQAKLGHSRLSLRYTNEDKLAFAYNYLGTHGFRVKTNGNCLDISW